MYVHVCVYIYTHIPINLFIYIYIYIDTYACICVFVCVCVCLCVCIDGYINRFLWSYMCMSVFVFSIHAQRNTFDGFNDVSEEKSIQPQSTQSSDVEANLVDELSDNFDGFGVNEDLEKKMAPSLDKNDVVNAKNPWRFQLKKALRSVKSPAKSDPSTVLERKEKKSTNSDFEGGFGFPSDVEDELEL